MPIATPRPLPLPDALALACSLGQRPDISAPQRLAPVEWTAEASAALRRRDRAALERLLRAELAPAIAKAVSSLGSAVTALGGGIDDDDDAWLLELVVLLDGTCLALRHAIEVVGVAERSRTPGDPAHAGRGRSEAGSGLRLAEVHGDELHVAVVRELAEALRHLAAPAHALVLAVDDDEPPGRPLALLQEPLQRAHRACAGALAHALALCDEGPLGGSGPVLVRDR